MGQALCPHHLALAIDYGNLSVLAAPETPLISLSDSGGAIIGTLFSARDSRRRLETIDQTAQLGILKSNGAQLVREYWGSYVAVLRGPNSCGIQVIRDPSATLPCYYISCYGVTVVASSVDLLIDSQLFQPEVNWPAVAQHLIAPQLRIAETCIAGLTELLGGYSLIVGAGELHVSQLWSPWDFVTADQQITDEALAADLVRDVTLSSVGAWASSFNHVVLGLSGGLDSSIVATCLSRKRIPFSCITLVTEGATGDERDYARVVSEFVGAPLFEEFQDTSHVDIQRSDASHLPRPIARSFAQSGDLKSLEVATHVQADAFFGGGGGDNVFCYLQSAAPIADRLRTSGIGPSAWRTVLDISRLAECSVWTAMKAGIRRAWFRDPAFSWPTNTAFLTSKASELAPPLHLHDWLRAPARALPGKAAHIAWLLGFQNHIEGFGRERLFAKVSPLMSQPLVELCLRIPTWMWCAGGNNRAVARRAFGRDLPEAILTRRSKGTPGSFVIELFEANRHAILKMLSEGVLANQALIDLDKLEAAITSPKPPPAADIFRIMMLVDVEAWARSWASRAKTRPTVVGAVAS